MESPITISRPVIVISVCFLIIWLRSPITAGEKSVNTSELHFKKSTQQFEPLFTNRIALGDLDKDGDLDAVFANFFKNHSQVWWNDGKGNFADSGQKLKYFAHGVSLADVDNDGDLDLLLAGGSGEISGQQFSQPTTLYMNDGKGYFEKSTVTFFDEKKSCVNVDLIDINNDGAPDALLTFFDFKNKPPNEVFFNDGKGKFKKSTLTFPSGSHWVDVNKDKALDLFYRINGEGFFIKLNDGKGQFKDYWQYKDKNAVRGTAASGDLDNDGDMDLVVSNASRNNRLPTRIFLNQGDGTFNPSPVTLKPGIVGRMSISDLNNDGCLDILLISVMEDITLWKNDGRGRFIESKTKIDIPGLITKCCTGDLDKDGDIDLFFANFRGGPNEIYFNTLINR